MIGQESELENKNYKLSILPLFEEDLNGIVDYISGTLKNPQAASNLVDAVEKAIYERLPDAESFKVYESTKQREHDYYTIQVKNYTIFYVVIDDVMEVRRIIYSRRDMDSLI